MKLPAPIKRTGHFLRDTVEIYIPALSFIIMFMIFVLQIFFRYVVRQPLPWAYEVTVSCYLWLVILGACFAQRDRSHVMFTLFYDKLGTKGKAFCAFLGNTLIAFCFSVSIIPSIQFVDFMKMSKTSVLKVGLNWIYAPYIVFLIFMVFYMLRDMVHEFRIFTGIASNEEARAYLNESLTEYEQAMEMAEKEAAL